MELEELARSVTGLGWPGCDCELMRSPFLAWQQYVSRHALQKPLLFKTLHVLSLALCFLFLIIDSSYPASSIRIESGQLL
jgi:hypothetical protein